MEENDPFWTKFYAKLLKEFEIEYCRQYPDAKAILIMINIIAPPEDAKYTIKILYSKVGYFMDDSAKVRAVGGLGSFDHNDLNGQVRGGGQNTIFFILDFDITTRASTSKRITTVVLGFQNEMFLEYCRIF